jgi:hypothetical protein
VFWAPEAAHARLARLIAGEQPERARKMLEHASETLSSLLGDTHPESVAAATALAEFAAR